MKIILSDAEIKSTSNIYCLHLIQNSKNDGVRKTVVKPDKSLELKINGNSLLSLK